MTVSRGYSGCGDLWCWNWRCADGVCELRLVFLLAMIHLADMYIHTKNNGATIRENFILSIDIFQSSDFVVLQWRD